MSQNKLLIKTPRTNKKHNVLVLVNLQNTFRLKNGVDRRDGPTEHERQKGGHRQTEHQSESLYVVTKAHNAQLHHSCCYGDCLRADKFSAYTVYARARTHTHAHLVTWFRYPIPLQWLFRICLHCMTLLKYTRMLMLFVGHKHCFLHREPRLGVSLTFIFLKWHRSPTTAGEIPLCKSKP